MEASTAFGSDLQSITYIGGAKTITLAKLPDNGTTVGTCTAYKADGTSKVLSFNTPQDIEGYSYIKSTAYFSMRFGRGGSIVVTDIS